MKYTTDDLIEDLLRTIEEYHVLDLSDHFAVENKLNLDDLQISHLRDKLIEHDFIETVDEFGLMVKITPKGSEINRNGGYVRFKQEWEEEQAEKKLITQKRKEKLLSDTELSRLTLEDFPRAKKRANLALIISISALFIALAQFLIAYFEMV